MIHMRKETYRRYADARAHASPLVRDCLRAFLAGGTVCCLGQVLRTLYGGVLALGERDAATLTSVTLIALAVLLTGLGVFDDIAGWAGAGTLVPITGFANAVASSAMDSRAEGWVSGVGAKIFTVAGPVLLWGIASGVVAGVLLHLLGGG